MTSVAAGLNQSCCLRAFQGLPKKSGQRRAQIFTINRIDFINRNYKRGPDRLTGLRSQGSQTRRFERMAQRAGIPDLFGIGRRVRRTSGCGLIQINSEQTKNRRRQFFGETLLQRM